MGIIDRHHLVVVSKAELKKEGRATANEGTDAGLTNVKKTPQKEARNPQSNIHMQVKAPSSSSTRACQRRG